MDRYDIALDIKFETHVPAPVILVDPSIIDIDGLVDMYEHFPDFIFETAFDLCVTGIRVL